MRNYLLNLMVLFSAAFAFGQAGHIMQGVGSVNMSMGGAATAQPIDISGALQWNPASISVFDGTELRFDVGLFFSSPELSATVPEVDGTGQPTGRFFSGSTPDDRGMSPLPALAVVWGEADSKHTFGVSAFGISGFGVTFPEETRTPQLVDDTFIYNPITAPQSQRGFGRIESEYILLQVGFTYAYEITDQLSIGVQPNLNFATLELLPNPTATPGPSGYPGTDKATAVGIGGQVGLFYDSGSGFKAGLAYKSTQAFGDFELENTYLDESSNTNEFKINYPAIYSLGLGYSLGNVDLALDYRIVDYENTAGFKESGWTIVNGQPTGSVAGFGWDNISIISAGIQFKGIDKLPIRVGYTYSSNPINNDLAFFSIPATAIIKNAFQFGLTYEVNDRLQLNTTYHHGDSGGATRGPVLDPSQVLNFPPNGAIPGTEVSYDMTTDMVMFGFSYKWLNSGGNQ
ncbi:OmpP1/FadL family transporter [Lentiprolixibacter aurantiacus]|uniref:Porin n=1 Tax=Lentiprolixibacter aurantiacus TaxID=2993939 RepID=A0AAE3MMS4_9FLAO|nr:porin [Lentiprolixibacter aurantiacus]MCX2720318.1 porin [Lentiprolixibacter aurantiacus]